MENGLKKIVILGSTGSIGRAAVEIVKAKEGGFDVVGLAAGENAELLTEQLSDFPSARFAVKDKHTLNHILSIDPSLEERSLGTGDEGLVRLIEETESELVVNAVVGIAGLKPTIEALEKGCMVALANKETIVTAGEYIFARFPDARKRIVPIDSEHFSLLRCLEGYVENTDEIILTASGGPFFRNDHIDLGGVSVADVLNHPTWSMGKKVTVDSAHLLNKGFEVIEARWLFDFPYESIKILVHPQSIVHSAIRLKDGSLIAHMAPADMRLPIMGALYYPEIVVFPWKALGLDELGKLEFIPLEKGMFPAFDIAMEAASKGGTATVVLNAADEMGVEAFLKGRIGFLEIIELIEEALSAHEPRTIEDIDDIFLADQWAKGFLKKKHPEIMD